MSYKKFTSDMPGSSASLVNGNQKTANVYDYDSQAQLVIQGNSMFSSGIVPYGYNPFSYLDNELPINHPPEYSRSGYLNNNGKSTSSFQGNPSTILENPENSHNVFLNTNSKSSSHDMIMEAGNPSIIFDEYDPFLSSHPSGILGNSDNSYSVFRNNQAKSSAPIVQGNSGINVSENMNPLIGYPSTITGNGFNFPTESQINIIGSPDNILVNPNPYFQITSPTIASGSLINDARENNTFRSISGIQIGGTGSRNPAEEQEKLRFNNLNSSFAGRVGTNLRATPPSISNRGRVETADIRQSRREDEPMRRQPTLMEAVLKKMSNKGSKRKVPEPTISKPAPPTPKRRKHMRQNRAPQVNTNAHDWENDEVVILTRAQFESSTGGKIASKGKNVQDPIGSIPKNFKRGIDYAAMAKNYLKPVKVEPDLFGSNNLPSLSYIQNQGPSNRLHHSVMHGTGKSFNALFSGTIHPNHGNVTFNPYPIDCDNLIFPNNRNFVFKNNGLGNTSNIPHHIDVPSKQREGKNPIIESKGSAYGKMVNFGENEPLVGGSSNRDFEHTFKGSGPSGEGDQLDIFSDQENYGLDWSSYKQIKQSPDDFWNF